MEKNGIGEDLFGVGAGEAGAKPEVCGGWEVLVLLDVLLHFARWEAPFKGLAARDRFLFGETARVFRVERGCEVCAAKTKESKEPVGVGNEFNGFDVAGRVREVAEGDAKAGSLGALKRGAIQGVDVWQRVSAFAEGRHWLFETAQAVNDKGYEAGYDEKGNVGNEVGEIEQFTNCMQHGQPPVGY